MKLRIFLLVLVSLVMVSCMSDKDKYVRDHQHFTEQFLEQNETYTATDWEAAETRYLQLREQYATLMTDMSAEERKSIDECNSKIDAVFVRHGIDTAATQFESLINEGIGVLNELFK